jgi:hypothetical protein
VHDFFAVLGCPRAVWIDPGHIREAFQELSGRPEGPGQELLNEARRVLEDPQERLAHLIALGTGRPPAPIRCAGGADRELFFSIASFQHCAQELVAEASATSTRLEKAALAGRMNGLLEEATRLKEEVAVRQETLEQTLRGLTVPDSGDVAGWETLETCHAELGYLKKGAQTLTEWTLRLMEAMV